MAEVSVDNMEQNAELFVEKMGFAHDTEGLELSDDQLVNEIAALGFGIPIDGVAFPVRTHLWVLAVHFGWRLAVDL